MAPRLVLLIFMLDITAGASITTVLGNQLFTLPCAPPRTCQEACRARPIWQLYCTDECAHNGDDGATYSNCRSAKKRGCSWWAGVYTSSFTAAPHCLQRLSAWGSSKRHWCGTSGSVSPHNCIVRRQPPRCARGHGWSVPHSASLPLYPPASSRADAMLT